MEHDSAALARLDLILRDLHAVRGKLERPSQALARDSGSTDRPAWWVEAFPLLERAAGVLREVEPDAMSPVLHSAVQERMRRIRRELEVLSALSARGAASCGVLAELAGWTGWRYQPDGREETGPAAGAIHAEA